MKTLLTLQAHFYLVVPNTENSNEFVSNEETTLALLLLQNFAKSIFGS
jgi:hypothetical protein